jgi:hypothetical protein
MEGMLDGLLNIADRASRDVSYIVTQMIKVTAGDGILNRPAQILSQPAPLITGIRSHRKNLLALGNQYFY